MLFYFLSIHAEINTIEINKVEFFLSINRRFRLNVRMCISMSQKKPKIFTLKKKKFFSFSNIDFESYRQIITIKQIDYVFFYVYRHVQ